MMKKIILSALTFLFICSCSDGITEKTMSVSGTIKGLKKGTLYLQHVPDSTLVTIDSMQVGNDGRFSFRTELESPEIYYLYLDKKDNNDINDRITFFGEAGNITINTTWKTFDTNVTIEGSPTQKKYEEYQKVRSEMNKRNLAFMQRANAMAKDMDERQLDSLNEISIRNIQRGYAYSLSFALNNTDSYIAPYIALYEVADANRKYLDSINNALSPEVADSKYGRALKEYLAQ